jgi:hypothetical protein
VGDKLVATICRLPIFGGLGSEMKRLLKLILPVLALFVLMGCQEMGT